MGINAKRIRLVTFVSARCSAALGGALAAPTTSLVPGVGADMIVLSFAVVATAGLGQITGALVAALMIGLARSLAVYIDAGVRGRRALPDHGAGAAGAAAGPVHRRARRGRSDRHAPRCADRSCVPWSALVPVGLLFPG